MQACDMKASLKNLQLELELQYYVQGLHHIEAAVQCRLILLRRA